jgi:hypothetical protein
MAIIPPKSSARVVFTLVDELLAVVYALIGFPLELKGHSDQHRFHVKRSLEIRR